MPSYIDPKQPLVTNVDTPEPGTAEAQDAEKQPADSTHDEQEASTQVQRTATEGPRRMPQP